MEELRKDNNFDEIDKEIIGSCAINFFFGAGVNGDAFRMAKDFNKTLKILENILGENVKLEEGFTKITSDEHYEEAKQESKISSAFVVIILACNFFITPLKLDIISFSLVSLYSICFLKCS